jgi:1,5-anhydro-D-fructose reductase (1,5-anhydro-D-mannitol-forming)
MIRRGVVCAGVISHKRVGPALVSANNSMLAAVCDAVLQAAAELAARFAVPQTHTSSARTLADPRVDAVYLATHVHMHTPQAIEALRAGKHVLVEKPMALTLAEAEKMVRVARATGRTLATAYYRRFFPKVQRVRQLIAEGVLGQVVMVTSVYHTWYTPPPPRPGPGA